jgi:hypothetical protein
MLQKSGRHPIGYKIKGIVGFCTTEIKPIAEEGKISRFEKQFMKEYRNVLDSVPNAEFEQSMKQLSEINVFWKMYIIWPVVERNARWEPVISSKADPNLSPLST